jgi:hypothetical protein
MKFPLQNTENCEVYDYNYLIPLGAAVIVGGCFFALWKGIQWCINQPTKPLVQPGLPKTKLIFTESHLQPTITESNTLLNQRPHVSDNFLYGNRLLKKTDFAEH